MARARACRAPYGFESASEEWSLAAAAERGLQVLSALSFAGTGGERQLDSDASRIVFDHTEYLLVFGGAANGPDETRAALFLTLAGALFDGRGAAREWLRTGQCRLLSAYVAVKSGSPSLSVPAMAAALEAIREARLPVLATLTEVMEREKTGRRHDANVFQDACTSRVSYPWLAPDIESVSDDRIRALGYAGAYRIRMTPREFFEALDLTAPPLGAVHESFERGDLRSAASRYAESLLRLAPIANRFAPLAKVEYEEKIDISEADDLCRNIYTLRAHMHQRFEFGERVDWRSCPFDDIEANVWLNAHPDMVTMAHAYERTGDDKYLWHLIRLMTSWLDDSPPTDYRSALQWRTLEAGNRTGQKWPAFFFRALQWPKFREKLLFRMAVSYLEHARYLAAFRAAGKNWLQVETTGLGIAALLFPEANESEHLLEIARRRLQWINGEVFLPDGFQSEGSSGYHAFPVMGIAGFYLLSKLLGREIPDAWLEQLEKILDVFVFLARPDLNLPRLNDCSPALVSPKACLRLGARLVPRERYDFILSDRARGRPPSRTSFAFPHAGYYVMRSGWLSTDQYLVFDAGHFGTGHQHEDKLSFELFAEGRPLITDPSIYQYRRDEFAPYFKGTRGHNAVLIDGKEQLRRLAAPREARPDPKTRWVMSDAFDFAEGWYEDGFAPPLAVSRDWTEEQSAARKAFESLDTSLRHRRRIFYIKGDYWILLDDILGAGCHRIEQVFHIAPIMESPTANGVRPARVRALGSAFLTDEPNLGNVAILPVCGDKAAIHVECGSTNPVAGWTALYGKQPSHDVTYTVSAELPFSLPVVLLPMPPGGNEVPRITPLEVGDRGVGMEIAWSSRTDFFLCSAAGARAMSAGGIECFGEAVHLRLIQGVPSELRMLHGRRAAYRGKALAEERATVETLFRAMA